MTGLALLLAAAALGALAVLAWLAARAGRSGLPGGRMLYSDTGALGRPRALSSPRHRLKGRPDYVIEVAGGVAPIEVKSAALPASGRAHRGHVMQLAAYCLLCEEAYGAAVPYGVVRYRDGEVRVEFTAALREELLALLGEMRAARTAGRARRSHDRPRRCAGCGFRDQCDESLA